MKVDFMWSAFLLRMVGFVAVLFSSWGLWVTAINLTMPPKHDDVFAMLFVYYAMTMVTGSLCAMLLFFGGSLFAGSTRSVPAFVATLILELLFFCAVVIGWALPFVGKSIAIATGVTTAPIGAQLMILFPIWAPFLSIALRRRIDGNRALAESKDI